MYIKTNIRERFIMASTRTVVVTHC